jgi:hypothetical protein
MSSTIVQKTSEQWDWKLWFQWILANAASETVGLGTTLLIGAFLLVNAEPTIGALPAAALGVLAGTVIEGSIVGTAQWLVLRHPLEKMRWHTWVLVTALGACVAWTLGMIPSTMLFTAPESGAAAPGEMSDLMIYTLAAAMGIALGAILGAAQWLALRRQVPKAGWWIPANALAWMLGMVVVFLGTSFIPAEGITVPVALILLLFVVAAGAVVGAIHGLVLIWLLHQRHLGAMA